MQSNPVARKQWQRLRALGPKWWIAALLVWGAAVWFFRFAMPSMIPLNRPGGMWGWLWDFALVMATYCARADVPTVLLIVGALVPRAEWQALRGHLAATPLGPRAILAGYLLPPAAILAGLNLLAAPTWYPSLSDTAGILGVRGADAAIFLCVMLPVAVAEDILFGSLCLLAIYRQHLLGTDLMLGAARALALIIGCAAVVAGLSNIAMAIPIPPDWFTERPLAAALVPILGATAFQFLFEAAVVLMLWRTLRVRFALWLAGD